MQYISQYPFYRPSADILLTLGDAQEMFGRNLRLTSPDGVLEAAGLVRVVEPTEIPMTGRYERLDERSPVLKDGAYVRQLVVVPMFPSDVNVRGALITVEQQKARYDAGLLAEARERAVGLIQLRFTQAFGAPWRCEHVDCELGLFDVDVRMLDDAYLVTTGQPTMPVFGRDGLMHTVPRAVAAEIIHAAAKRRIELLTRRAKLLAAVNAAQSDTAVAAIDISYPA